MKGAVALCIPRAYYAGKMTSVYADGSCVPRDGAMKCGMGIYYPDHPDRSEAVSLPRACSTNNVAELCAILYVMCTVMDSTDLVIYTDSMYAIQCLTTWIVSWESNGWRTSNGGHVRNTMILKDMIKIKRARDRAGSTTELVHVKGHSGNPGNEMADILARRGSETACASYRLEMLIRSGVSFPH